MEHGRLKLFDLSGKVAVVTGGNGGIGLGMAQGAGLGWRLLLSLPRARCLRNRRPPLKDLASRGTSVLTIPVDVTQEASVSGLFAATLERCGRLDILVNNAGTNIRHPAHELSLAQWHTVIDTNLTSAFMCAKAAYPTLKRGGGGKIINIGSMMSIFGAPFARLPTRPAKAASSNLTRSLASAWARDNIQANAVLPGWIDTDLTRGAREQIPGLNENVLGRTPAARWGAIDDLSGIAVFLATGFRRSPISLLGRQIPVDGGYS